MSSAGAVWWVSVFLGAGWTDLCLTFCPSSFLSSPAPCQVLCLYPGQAEEDVSPRLESTAEQKHVALYKHLKHLCFQLQSLSRRPSPAVCALSIPVGCGMLPAPSWGLPAPGGCPQEAGAGKDSCSKGLMLVFSLAQGREEEAEGLRR